MGKERVQLNEIEMVTKGDKLMGAARMPRTAIVPVVNDPKYGINAGTVSAGVVNLNPLHILFGVRSPDSKLTYHDAKEFVVAVPRKDQLDQMWVTACSVPVGINEVELAGWTELPSRMISTPGIKEVPLNLECKKVHMIQLEEPQRCVVIGEVVGVSIDTQVLSLPRSEVIKQFPMHESAINTHTGYYGPGLLSGELLPSAEQPPAGVEHRSEGGKTFVKASDLYNPENEAAAVNAIFPRPSYIVITLDKNGHPEAFPTSGGMMMATNPAVQIAVPRGSYTYENIKRTGEFVYAIPTRDLLENFEALENNLPGGFEAAGFSFLKPNQTKVPGLAECPVNVDCRVARFEDVAGADYAIVVAHRIGVSLDKELADRMASNDVKDALGNMDLYSQYLYAVMDRGMKRKWGFNDRENLSVRPLPSFGSRYYGGWWTGHEQYHAGFCFWLLELIQEGYLSEQEFFKLQRWIALFRRDGVTAPEPLWSELKKRLTTVLKMMVWAHRDFEKWLEFHQYMAKYLAKDDLC